MIFIQNKYTKWYFDIVNNAKCRSLPIDEYSENHHIVPDCFYIARKRKGPKGWLPGNPEEATNKVRLTIREHVVCHWLLIKMTTSKEKAYMVQALNMLSVRNKHQKGYRIISRAYEQNKLAALKVRAEKAKGMTVAVDKTTMKPIGKVSVNDPRWLTGEIITFSSTINWDTKAKKDQAEKRKLGRWWNNGDTECFCQIPPDNSYTLGRSKSAKAKYSKVRTPESNAKRAITLLGKTKGVKKMPLTAEQKANVSNSKKGILDPVVTCPHCKKIGGNSGMKRWHFNNCKLYES